MNKIFKDFQSWVRVHSGINKPKINFQDMYRLFPDFDFTPSPGFGEYQNFGEAFERKNYSMTVTSGKAQCFLTYYEYQDQNENLAYVS